MRYAHDMHMTCTCIMTQIDGSVLLSMYTTGSGSSIARIAGAHLRHSAADSPAAPSPSHSRSGSSEGYSSRRSSRDSGRGVVSPTHHHGSQRSSSAEMSPTSPIHKSAYEKMLNGAASYGKKMQPAVNGSTSRGKPSGGVTRRVVSVVGQPTSPPGRERPLSSPNPPGTSSPSKYIRKPHQYDFVRYPHGYEEVDFPSQGPLQLSQASTKSEAKLNRLSRKSDSEKHPNNSSNKRTKMHLSVDSRLNKITRRKGSDKPFTVRKSPAISKRFSTGATMMGESEARRVRENSAAFVKAKYRVSNPEPSSHHYHYDGSFGATGGGNLAEEELAQDDVVFFDDRPVRKFCEAPS